MNLDITRAGYLGGTDAAAVCGKDEWKSRLEVWLAKMGRAHPAPPSARERMNWGSALEPVILREYQARYGMELSRCPQVISKDEPWRGGHCDGVAWEPGQQDRIATIDDPRGTRLIEVKVIAGSSRGKWLKAVPTSYVYQAQHYLDLYELQLCTFVVLFGGNEMLTFDVAADPIVQHEIRVECRKFWHDFVIPGVPPPLTEDLKGEEFEKAPNAVEVGADTISSLERLVELGEQAAELEAEAEAIKATLRDLAPPGGALSVAGKAVARWITKNRAESVIKAKTWDEFRITPRRSLDKILRYRLDAAGDTQ